METHFRVLANKNVSFLGLFIEKRFHFRTGSQFPWTGDSIRRAFKFCLMIPVLAYRCHRVISFNANKKLIPNFLLSSKYSYLWTRWGDGYPHSRWRGSWPLKVKGQLTTWFFLLLCIQISCFTWAMTMTLSTGQNSCQKINYLVLKTKGKKINSKGGHTRQMFLHLSELKFKVSFP